MTLLDLLDLLMVLAPVPVFFVAMAASGVRRLWRSWPAIWALGLFVGSLGMHYLPGVAAFHYAAFAAPVACFGELAAMGMNRRWRPPILRDVLRGAAMAGLVVLGGFGLLYANSFTNGLLFVAETSNSVEQAWPTGCFRALEVDAARVLMAGFVAAGAGLALELFGRRIAGEPSVVTDQVAPEALRRERAVSAFCAGVVVIAALFGLNLVDRLPKCDRGARPTNTVVLHPADRSAVRL
ncbi:hypothetical protein ABIC83_002500 [Roseateles asaccharophilus]|uniref:hypothetical protein n=1 Tax=Roseateles asaccharophilus TaxID=582607 RepID=UPI0038396A72